MKGTAEQLRGNLKGFKKAVRRRDLELERLKRDRNAIIEECALVIEQWEYADEPLQLARVAAAIRALKNKP